MEKSKNSRKYKKLYVATAIAMSMSFMVSGCGLDKDVTPPRYNYVTGEKRIPLLNPGGAGADLPKAGKMPDITYPVGSKYAGYDYMANPALREHASMPRHKPKGTAAILEGTAVSGNRSASAAVPLEVASKGLVDEAAIKIMSDSPESISAIKALNSPNPTARPTRFVKELTNIATSGNRYGGAGADSAGDGVSPPHQFPMLPPKTIAAGSDAAGLQQSIAAPEIMPITVADNSNYPALADTPPRPGNIPQKYIDAQRGMKATQDSHAISQMRRAEQERQVNEDYYQGNDGTDGSSGAGAMTPPPPPPAAAPSGQRQHMQQNMMLPQQQQPIGAAAPTYHHPRALSEVAAPRETTIGETLRQLAKEPMPTSIAGGGERRIPEGNRDIIASKKATSNRNSTASDIVELEEEPASPATVARETASDIAASSPVQRGDITPLERDDFQPVDIMGDGALPPVQGNAAMPPQTQTAEVIEMPTVMPMPSATSSGDAISPAPTNPSQRDMSGIVNEDNIAASSSDNTQRDNKKGGGIASLFNWSGKIDVPPLRKTPAQQGEVLQSAETGQQELEREQQQFGASPYGDDSSIARNTGFETEAAQPEAIQLVPPSPRVAVDSGTAAYPPAMASGRKIVGSQYGYDSGSYSTAQSDVIRLVPPTRFSSSTIPESRYAGRRKQKRRYVPSNY